MTLPRLTGVSESTTEDFLSHFALTQGDQLAPRIVDHAGRVIRVQRYSGVQLDLTCLGFLLGPSGVVDEMRVSDVSTLTARLKTDAQLAADKQALEIDEEAESKLSARDKLRLLTTIDLSAIRRRTKAFDRRKVEPKERKMYGTSAIVMRAAQELAAEGPADVDDLIAEAVSKMPSGGVKRGEDRRAEYADNALQKLIRQGALHHHDDQTRVGLTPEEQDE